MRHLNLELERLEQRIAPGVVKGGSHKSGKSGGSHKSGKSHKSAKTNKSHKSAKTGKSH
jgi:hypothetical protein